MTDDFDPLPCFRKSNRSPDLSSSGPKKRKYSVRDMQFSSLAYAKGRDLYYVIKSRESESKVWINFERLSELIESARATPGSVMEIMEFDFDSIPAAVIETTPPEPEPQ